jgi:sulfate/thiosulfate transport system substrate-binding protein
MNKVREGVWVRAAAERKVVAAMMVALVMVGALATACGGRRNAAEGARGGAPSATQLALVAYSTPKEAYEKIIKEFQATPEGRDVTFTQSYGGSGDQSRAVQSGLPADIVAFSLEPDMARLVQAGIVAKDWNSDEYKGMVTDSVVVFVVRKGNPKHIRTWADLVKPGIEVVTPNPFTSGGARWNAMAAFGAGSKAGKDEAAGVAYLTALFANVKVQDESARKSLQTFTSGRGDVLLAYENEAIFAQQAGADIDYVVPADTMLIENPVAVTTTSNHPKQAAAFLAFLHSEQAQRIFADAGYRPVVKGVVGNHKFPDPSGLFTIADFGGWSTVTKKFFDPAASIMADVERGLGVFVGKG